MPRRRWRWDPKINNLVEIPLEDKQEPVAPMITPDFEEFRSTVDGTVIVGRRALREHNKRNNVTNTSDFTETWAKAAKEREQFYSGDSRYDRARRIEALKYAIDKHMRRR